MAVVESVRGQIEAVEQQAAIGQCRAAAGVEAVVLCDDVRRREHLHAAVVARRRCVRRRRRRRRCVEELLDDGAGEARMLDERRAFDQHQLAAHVQRRRVTE